MTGEQIIYAYARFLAVQPTPGEIIHAGQYVATEIKHNTAYLQFDPRIFSEPKGKRKNLFVYSSCHCEQIAHYLTHYRQDVLDGYYLHYLMTHRMALTRPASDNRLIKAMFANADLVIWNVLGSKFQEQSTEVLGKHLKPEARVVSFVPPCFAAFWPIAEFFGEEGVVAYLEAGKNVEEIIELFRSGRFDCKFELRFKDQIERLAFREADRDVKLSAFIQRNYVNHKLFLTVNHPAYPTVAYIVENCLGYLGFKEKGEAHCLAREVNEAEFGAHLPETNYEFAYYGFKYPLRYPKERGGADAYYTALIKDAAARWKARGGGLHYTDKADDY